MRGATGNNNSDLTEMNRSVVVKILQQREVCSRADIARETGLTQAAITKIVAVLMEMGIVSEVGSIKGSGNRRSIGLKLSADRHKVIGVKFARNVVAVGVFDISGKLYQEMEREYSLTMDRSSVLSSMKKQIHEMLAEYEDVVAIGIAVPGPYLREEGHIAVITQMPSWHDINFIDEFCDEFDKPVYIEHDANAGALAEWWFGEHDNSPHTLCYYLVGEGVGSGIIQNGELLLGVQGAASEIGHISVDVNGERCECGNYGCLELYCSAPAILKKGRKEVPECFKDDHDGINAVFEAARNGNKKAMDIVSKAAEYIGFGCVTLINAYNPDIIVIGDSVAKAGDMMMPIIKRVVEERAIVDLAQKCDIKLSSLGVDPTLAGAAAIATDKVLALPSAFAADAAQYNGFVQV